MCTGPFIIVFIVSAIGFFLFGVPGLLGGVFAGLLIAAFTTHGLKEHPGHSRYEGPINEDYENGSYGGKDY